MRSHDTVSKFAYVSIFTYVSKCVHVNGASVYLLHIAKYLQVQFLCMSGPIHMHTYTYASKDTHVSKFTYDVMWTHFLM